MTQIGISTQEILGNTSLNPVVGQIQTIVDVTISAVDLTRSYVEMGGHASGLILDHTCPVVSFQFTPKGSTRDGNTINWVVELLNSTTVRFFRPVPIGVGARHRLSARVVEYT